MLYGIKVGSVTNAQRAVKLLRSRGFKPTLSRIENLQPNNGCGYEIKVRADDDGVINLLRNAGITILDTEVL